MKSDPENLKPIRYEYAIINTFQVFFAPHFRKVLLSCYLPDKLIAIASSLLIALIIVNMTPPSRLLVSYLLILLEFIPRFLNAYRADTRCLVLRENLSNLQTNTISNFHIYTLFIKSLSVGLVSFVPDTPGLKFLKPLHNGYK